jgi:hypothetical protein
MPNITGVAVADRKAVKEEARFIAGFLVFMSPE